MAADGTLWGLTALLFVFTLLAIFNGCQWAVFQRKNLTEIATDQVERLENHVREINDYERENDRLRVEAPHSTASIGTYTMHYVAKPPHPNAIFAIGQSDLYPYYARFSSLQRNNMLMNEEIANPVNLLVGKLDYSFFLVYLLPLLIIAMAYDLLTSEREQGTLTLLRIYQPKTARFLLAKSLFRVLWLLAALYLSVFAGMLLFSPFALGEFDVGTLAILGFSTVYALFWFALCFAVNMLGRNSLFNGIAMSMFWLFVVFLLPTLVNTLMEKRHPIPSRNAQIVQQREIKENIDREAIFQKYLLTHPEYSYDRPGMEDDGEDGSPPRWYRTMVTSRLHLDSLHLAGERRFQRVLAEQEKGLETLGYASPSLMATMILNRIGRNALGDFEDFNAQVRAHHQYWRTFVYDRILRGKPFAAEDLSYQPNFVVAELRSLPIGRMAFQLLWMLALAAALMATGLALWRKNFG